MDEFAKKTNITLVFGLSAWYGREASNKAMNFSNTVNSIKYANILRITHQIYLHLNLVMNYNHSNTHAIDLYALFLIICNTSINSNLKLIGNDHFSSMNGIILISYFDADYAIAINGKIKNIIC